MKYGQPRGPWTDAFSARTALPGAEAESANTPPLIATITQLVALTTWGNGFLRRGADVAALNRDHSTLRNCNKVAFADIRGLLRSREVPIAADPITWLRIVRDEGCRFLRLRHESAATTPSLPGTAGWRIEACLDETVDQWVPEWTLTNRYAAQNRRWSVVYRRESRKTPYLPSEVGDLQSLRAPFSAAVVALQGFATCQNQTQWSLCLGLARTLMDLEKPFEGSPYADLVPRAGGSPAARQLLAACCHALGCEVDKTVPPTGEDPDLDSENYQRLMGEMLSIVMDCVQHCANQWTEESP